MSSCYCSIAVIVQLLTLLLQGREEVTVIASGQLKDNSAVRAVKSVV